MTVLLKNPTGPRAKRTPNGWPLTRPLQTTRPLITVTNILFCMMANSHGVFVATVTLAAVANRCSRNEGGKRISERRILLAKSCLSRLGAGSLAFFSVLGCCCRSTCPSIVSICTPLCTRSRRVHLLFPCLATHSLPVLAAPGLRHGIDADVLGALASICTPCRYAHRSSRWHRIRSVSGLWILSVVQVRDIYDNYSSVKLTACA